MNDDDLAGTLGGAVIATEDPFGDLASPAISYIVFPDEAGATERFAAIEAIRGEDAGVRIAPVETLAYPAAIVAFQEQALCIVRVGYVLIIASIAPSGDDAADDTMVAKIAESGIGHLLAVAEAVAA